MARSRNGVHLNFWWIW